MICIRPVGLSIIIFVSWTSLQIVGDHYSSELSTGLESIYGGAEAETGGRGP